MFNASSSDKIADPRYIVHEETAAQAVPNYEYPPVAPEKHAHYV